MQRNSEVQNYLLLKIGSTILKTPLPPPFARLDQICNHVKNRWQQIDLLMQQADNGGIIIRRQKKIIPCRTYALRGIFPSLYFLVIFRTKLIDNWVGGN